MYFIFRLVVPLLVLILVNIKLLITLRVASRDRAQLTRSQNSKVQTNSSRKHKHQVQKKDYFTTILVSVVSVFIVCQFPDFLLRIVVTINSFTSYQFELQYFNTITNMLLTMNSSINCLIYCLTGHRFRKILVRQLCRLFLSRHQHHIAMDETFTNDGTKQSALYIQETTI